MLSKSPRLRRGVGALEDLKRELVLRGLRHVSKQQVDPEGRVHPAAQGLDRASTLSREGPTYTGTKRRQPGTRRRPTQGQVPCDDRLPGFMAYSAAGLRAPPSDGPGRGPRGRMVRHRQVGADRGAVTHNNNKTKPPPPKTGLGVGGAPRGAASRRSAPGVSPYRGVPGSYRRSR